MKCGETTLLDRYNDADDNNYENDDDDDVIGTECLSTTICRTRRCSRCTEAIRNGASIDLTASGTIA
jgi:hypothetical protein